VRTYHHWLFSSSLNPETRMLDIFGGVSKIRVIVGAGAVGLGGDGGVRRDVERRCLSLTLGTSLLIPMQRQLKRLPVRVYDSNPLQFAGAWRYSVHLLLRSSTFPRGGVRRLMPPHAAATSLIRCYPPIFLPKKYHEDHHEVPWGLQAIICNETALAGQAFINRHQCHMMNLTFAFSHLAAIGIF
jgi:hypothetical protein